MTVTARYALRMALLALAGAALLLAAGAPARVSAQTNEMRSLVTVAEPSGGGTFTPAGTAVSGQAGTWSSSQTKGTTVTVTATPNAGYRFDRWSEDCTGTGACTVSMDTGRTVRARFVRIHTVTVTASPSGAGSAAGHISPVTTDGMLTYDAGTRVILTATPSSGYRFQGWSGSGCSGRGTCTVTLSADRAVTAEFVPILTLAATPAECGTLYVRRDGENVNFGAIGEKYYPQGTVVHVSQTAKLGCAFSAWSGDCTGTGACSFTMNQGRGVTATYTRTFYIVTATVSPVEAGLLTGFTALTTPAGAMYRPYAPATPPTTATITAPTRAGYRFSAWSGDCTGATCSLTMDSDKSITATFVRTHTLATSVSPMQTAGVIDHGSHAPGEIDDGDTVSLTVRSALGFRFREWTSDLGGCASYDYDGCTFTMTNDVSVTARFVESPTHSLTVRASPTAGGRTTGQGTGEATGRFLLPRMFGGVATYNEGDTVAITATPNTGYRFRGWSAFGCSGTGACEVTVTRDSTVYAYFIAQYDLTASASPSGGGSVALSPSGGTYDDGTEVTVTPTANSGYLFSSWSGACTGTGRAS